MDDSGQLFLTLDYSMKIREDDFVRKLIKICETLNYTELLNTYERTSKKADPVTMFELIVFGYMCGLYSSREIEESCYTDVRCMWILQGKNIPDHSTIARFQNGKLAPLIEGLFYQVVEKLAELGEVGYENVFVDGTKIEANANKYSFVWAKSVKKYWEKLNVKIEKELPPIALRYGMKESVEIEECLEHIKKFAVATGMQVVTGKGKRKPQLQHDIETLSEFVVKKQRYSDYTETFKGRNSFSKTDKDATFMRTKDDHMKNGQLKACYNVQIAVESEYIVGVGLFAKPGDVTTLIPFLERMYAQTGKRIKNFVADAGYESEENYDYLEMHGQKSFIKPSDYERSKKRAYKNNLYRADNLPYDEASNTFTCPNGKKLVFVCDKKNTTSNNYITTKQHYRCESCHECSHRQKCYKGKSENREIVISQNFIRHRKQSLENITSDEGILLRINRSIQVEGVFGVLKQDYGFTRFLTRGTQKTETQFFILAMAFNIKKLCNREKAGRFGKSLFEKKIV